MRTKASWSTSLTRAGNLRVNTSVKMPMFPTMKISHCTLTVLHFELDLAVGTTLG
jgi:hypothetical protein